MNDSPAVTPKLYCPRCRGNFPGDDFVLTGHVSAATPAQWEIDVLKHRACGKMVWRPAKARVEVKR